jgi:hypothetical protein
VTALATTVRELRTRLQCGHTATLARGVPRQPW